MSYCQTSIYFCRYIYSSVLCFQAIFLSQHTKKNSGALKVYLVTFFNLFLCSSFDIIYIFCGCKFSAVGVTCATLNNFEIFSGSTSLVNNVLMKSEILQVLENFYFFWNLINKLGINLISKTIL